jgi:murein DD-endopeptidase MepM/ murein hydrolase activator NlpD
LKEIAGFPRTVCLGMAMMIGGVVLAGCVRQGAPAPVVDRGNMFFGRGTAVPVARPATERPQPTAGTVVPPLVTTPGTVTVQSGDTLYGISRRNNVPIRAIINANNLAPPYTLPVGRQLVLPRQPYHLVAPGETITTIARAYNVSTQDLVRTNGIEPPYLIYVGEPVLLPLPTTGTPGGTAVAAAPPPAATSTAPQAMRDSQSSTTIVEAAPAPSGPSTPDGNGNAAPATGSPEPLSGPNPGPATSPQAGPPDAMPPDTLASLPPPTAPVEPSITAPPGAFIWPVQGRVLSAFGPKSGGLVNDGINIAAPSGTPVRASQDGTVAYAGNELRGYGNLLLLRHDNGWVTAYAHNSELLVKRGDRVKRGQVISRVGATGSVSEPQLHFEIRQGTRSVDPTRYLSGQGVSGRT